MSLLSLELPTMYTRKGLGKVKEKKWVENIYTVSIPSIKKKKKTIPFQDTQMMIESDSVYIS